MKKLFALAIAFASLALAQLQSIPLSATAGYLSQSVCENIGADGVPGVVPSTCDFLMVGISDTDATVQKFAVVVAYVDSTGTRQMPQQVAAARANNGVMTSEAITIVSPLNASDVTVTVIDDHGRAVTIRLQS